jgi:hypothetical protein
MRNLNLILSCALLLFLGGTAFAQTQDTPYTQEPGITSDLSKSITLYPNPATEYINIKLSTLEPATTKLIMYNILGKELQIEKEVVNEHEVRVKVKDLASGYYLLAIRDDQIHFKATYKFLKR